MELIKAQNCSILICINEMIPVICYTTHIHLYLIGQSISARILDDLYSSSIMNDKQRKCRCAISFMHFVSIYGNWSHSTGKKKTINSGNIDESNKNPVNKTCIQVCMMQYGSRIRTSFSPLGPPHLALPTPWSFIAVKYYVAKRMA